MKGLLLTYAATAVGAVAALRNPVWGLYLYVLYSIVRPQQMFGWAGDLSGISLLVGCAMLAGWAFAGFGSWRVGKASTLVGFLLAFLVWNAVSAVGAREPEVAWATVLERAKVVLPFLVGLTTLSTVEELRRLAWIIVLSHGYLGFEMNWAYLVEHYNRVAVEGYFGDNNTFAVALVAATGPALFLGFAARSLWQKALAFGSAALIMHTVLLTFSRGAILSLAVTGVAIVVLMPKRPGYLLALVLAAALGVRFMGPELTARFKTSFAEGEERDASAQSRLDLWRDALSVAAKYPIVGVGPRQWPFIAVEFGWPPGKEIHSTWCSGAAELGFVGISFLLGFYVVTMLKALVLAHRLKGTSYEVYGLYVCSGLLGFLVGAQFVTVEGSEVPYFIALVGAISLKLASTPEDGQSPAIESGLMYPDAPVPPPRLDVA